MRKVSRRGVAAARAEGKSLCARLAPSSGAQGSNRRERRSLRSPSWHLIAEPSRWLTGDCEAAGLLPCWERC